MLRHGVGAAWPLLEVAGCGGRENRGDRDRRHFVLEDDLASSSLDSYLPKPEWFNQED